MKPCPRCAGAGQLPLSDRQRQLLAALRPEPQTTREIRERIPLRARPSLQALLHQLRRLRALGLCVGERRGRECWWKINAKLS